MPQWSEISSQKFNWHTDKSFHFLKFNWRDQRVIYFSKTQLVYEILCMYDMWTIQGHLRQ